MTKEDMYQKWLNQIHLNPAIKEAQWMTGDALGEFPPDMSLDAAIWLVMVQDWLVRLISKDWDVQILIEDEELTESMQLNLYPEDYDMEIDEIEEDFPYNLSSDEGVLQSMLHLFGMSLDLSKPRTISTVVTLTNPSGGVYDFYLGIQP